MLAKRLLASSLMIGILVGGLALDVYVLHADLCFMLIVLLLMAGGSFEFYRLARNEGARPFALYGTLATLILATIEWLSLPHGPIHDGAVATLPPAQQSAAEIAANAVPTWLPKPWPLAILVFAFALAVMGAFLLAMRRKDLSGALRDIAVTVTGIVYIWFLCGFMIVIRHIGRDGFNLGGWTAAGSHWVSFGQRLMIAVVVAAKSVDTGGYTVGKLIGRHKLIPAVSPGKTVEGAIGGFVFAVAGIALVKALGFLNEFSWIQATVFALVVGVAGMFGDLAESVLKRSSGTKDAGGYVPGFGGVLDVIDSFMFACPVACLTVWVLFALR
ncbi:MAG: phosphatidate cytidylyltransferase [Planctomycetota bacterium]